MIINGVEIPDIDSGDLAAMEIYENALDVVAQKAEEAGTVCKKRTDLIRYQCGAIFEFFDTVFGPGTAKRVFGDSVNLRVCMETWESVIDNVNKQDEAFAEKYMRKYTPQVNRGKIYPNPNNHPHKKKKKRR